MKKKTAKTIGRRKNNRRVINSVRVGRNLVVSKRY